MTSRIEFDSTQSERRAATLLPLIAKSRCSLSAVRKAARELGISERTVFSLIRRLRQAKGDPAALAPKTVSGGRGQSRLVPEAEALIQRVINEAQTSSERPSRSRVIKMVLDQCRTEQIACPSATTIRRRLESCGFAGATRATAVDLSFDDHPPIHISTARNDDTLLESLYDVVGEQQGWARFADTLARSYAGGKAAIYVVDSKLRDWTAELGPQWAPDHEAAYNDYYSTRNPWMQDIATRAVGCVVTAESRVLRADLVKTEFYHDWLRPQGLLSGLSATVQQDGSRLMGATVLFPGKTEERDPGGARRLQRLVPHLLRVAQLKRQFNILESRTASAESMLDQLSVAICIVNSRREVVFSNKAAVSLLAVKDGVSIIHKSLQAVTQRDKEELQRLLGLALQANWATDAPPGGAMRIGRPSGKLAFEVLVSPISMNTISMGMIGRQAAVIVRDPEEQANAPTLWLRQLYSLTNAEAQVMHELMAGHTLAEIAIKLGKRPETIRSQLKAVFRKTGTESQSDLVRRGVAGFVSLHYRS